MLKFTMSRVVYTLCLFLVLSSLNYVSANSTRCYACHGDYCNDPFDKDKAVVMDCSYNSRLTQRSVEEFADDDAVSGDNLNVWESLERKLTNAFSVFFNKNMEHVCIKSSYYNYGQQRNVTIRRCMLKTYRNTDACGQLTNTINLGYGKINSCMTCDTDLCNSANTMTYSMVAIFIFSCLKSLL